MPGPTKIKIGITTLMSGGKLGSSYPVVSVEQRTVNRLYSEAEIVGVLVSSKTESNSSFYDGQFWRLREGTEEYEIIPDDSSDEENAGDGVGSLSCLTPLNIELVAKECKRIFDEVRDITESY